MIGRPYLWGLAAAGSEGVERVVRLLVGELELAMAQCGAASLAEITRDLTCSCVVPGGRTSTAGTISAWPASLARATSPQFASCS